MKIEERLHDALHGYADDIEPEPGSWERIAARFDDTPARAPRRSSRRPLVLAGVALVVIVVVVAGLLVRDVGDGTRIVTTPGASPSTDAAAPVAAPPGVLVAKRSGEMVVVGSQDGGQHSSLGTFPGATSVSTSPDGREVYFQSRNANTACPGGLGPDVTRLVPATGETTIIVGGMISPAVSTDGKWVAYGTFCDGRTLGLTSLVGRGNSRTNPLGVSGNEADDRVEKVEPLAWSPDSTLILSRLSLKGDPDPHYAVGRVWPVVIPEQTKVTELPSGSNVTAATFVDNDTVALAESNESATEIRSWRVATGSEEQPSPVLFRVPGWVTSLVADPSGRHFLAVTSSGDLYRWSRGDDGPVRVAGDVASATWLPWS